MLEITPTPVSDIINHYPNLRSLQHEDVLDLQAIHVDNPEIDHIFSTNGYLKINNSIIEPFIEKIPEIAFEELFLKISDMRIPGLRYITVLRIFYGYKNGGIDLIYQPLYLNWMFHDGATQKDIYQIQAVGPIYFYDENQRKFVEDTGGDNLTSITEYRNAISINQNGIYRNFDESPTSTDVTSCIFPFQTIFTLIVDNLEYHTEDPHFDKKMAEVSVHNCVRKVNYDPQNSAKHALLLSAHELENLHGPFTGRFANRSHLCPPCNGVNIGYDLA